MNKYLKILMLSGGLIGSIAVTAIDSKQSQNNDLTSIYEDVEKMQQALPNLSRINYKLNINLDQELNENESNLDNNISNIEQSQSSDQVGENNTNNITFSTTDENGEEQVLNKDETINYLDQTLNQTNIEYEALKTTLSNAIKDTMDYLEAYKNGEKSLTNEQKIYIKEHTNSIKFLAETLENLSEDVICCIDGCEDCDDDDFETTASNYLNIINQLETRINALNNAIASLQFINNITNPFFFRINPNQIIYGYEYNSNEENQDNETSLENNGDISNNSNNENNTDNNEKNDNVIEVENDKNNNEMNISNDDKPTTFGLKSNIDTYAPTKRNIDTFFNTALYNNDYNRYGGYGYGMPYGGYGMPYGAGFGNPYGANYANPYNEPNSNLINRNELEKQQNNATTTNTSANIETDTSKKSNTKHKKNKRNLNKRVSNIDTYSGTTVKSNINTMGESKISKYFKQKLNTLREKINSKKDSNNQPPKHTLPEIADPLDDLDKNNSNNTDSVYNNNNTQDIENNSYFNDNSNESKIETEDINIKQEKDIKAK